MAKNQGAQANLNGKVFEKMMIQIFQTNGFEIYTEKQLTILSKIPLKFVIKNAKYTTIYNEKGRTEFVIVFRTRKIRFEAKYQSVEGSVDEKYPYMLLNGIYQYPEDEIVFVVDGGGYKLGARNRLQEQINNNWLNFKEKGKNIKLMNIAEFINWFNHEFS